MNERYRDQFATRERLQLCFLSASRRRHLTPSFRKASAKMDMDMHMAGGDRSSKPALSADGIDFSNSTQAGEFLEYLLNDDELKIIGNDYAIKFWFGVVVIIGLATLSNFAQWLTLHTAATSSSRSSKTAFCQAENCTLSMVSDGYCYCTRNQLSPNRSIFNPLVDESQHSSSGAVLVLWVFPSFSTSSRSSASSLPWSIIYQARL